MAIADCESDDAGLGEGSVEASVVAEVAGEAVGDAENAAQGADVLTEDDNVVVRSQRVA